jgi:hypothetical protein
VVSEVREWLAAIGLPQYAEAFEADHIEVDLLGQLDDQMLKDIGVSSAGHRLRIRNAIAKLSPVVPFPKNEPASGAEPKPQDTAERRQVTVMFSDLVGSTALSAAWTPKTSARSFRPIRNALRRPQLVSEASWRSSWVTAS